MLRRVRPALLVTALALPCLANAFTVTISPGPRAIYLRVGTGGYNGTPYRSDEDTLQANTTVNMVSLAIPAAQVGNGTDLAMAVNGGTPQQISHWDNYLFCNPNQVYIGFFYRLPRRESGTATLTVTTPPSLGNGLGDAIPIDQIRWTTSGNSDGAGTTQPVPAGSFNGGVQTLATFGDNSWRESCMSFFYANDAVVPAGTYTGRATYTLTAP